VADSFYGCGARISRGVSVGLVVVDYSVGEDRIDGVAAVGLCGTAGGVGFVADDGDAGGGAWEDCRACTARDVGQDDFGGCFRGDGCVGVADFDDYGCRLLDEVGRVFTG
jgi:hypothetical protein